MLWSVFDNHSEHEAVVSRQLVGESCEQIYKKKTNVPDSLKIKTRTGFISQIEVIIVYSVQFHKHQKVPPLPRPVVKRDFQM